MFRITFPPSEIKCQKKSRFLKEKRFFLCGKVIVRIRRRENVEKRDEEKRIRKYEF